MASYDILGSIAVCKFGDESPRAEKIKFAKKLLNSHSNVKTVVEKSERVKGRLRVFKVRHLAGSRSLETEYKENGCVFKLNIEKCYFSSRLGNERKEIAKKIKKEKVLVMFGGVAPFGIVIAKLSGAEVVSVEIGRECCKYACENVKKNKVADKVEIVQGDVKRIVPKLKKRFDVIVMPRPNLRASFLDCALNVSKKGTKIFYYCFGRDEDLKRQLDEIKKKFGKKIKILRKKKAGEIAPYKWRWRVGMRVC